jgi:hypothetical protein
MYGFQASSTQTAIVVTGVLELFSSIRPPVNREPGKLAYGDIVAVFTVNHFPSVFRSGRSSRSQCWRSACEVHGWSYCRVSYMHIDPFHYNSAAAALL